MKFWSIIFCGLLGLSMGCGVKTLQEERIDNITRVFMHECDNYTLVIQRPGSAELEMRRFAFSNCENRVRLIADVPASQPLWAVAQRFTQRGADCNSACYGSLEIHVHSGQDINGAGWDHGKFGRGQTVPIQ